MSPPYLMGAPFGGGASPAAPLNGLQWLLPKTGMSGASWTCANPGPTVAVTMGGTPGVSYDVTLRFIGVIEMCSYDSGTTPNALTPHFYRHGNYQGFGWNEYQLEVSSPAMYWHLNRNLGGGFGSGAEAIDYSATIQIDAGATVTLRARSHDGVEAAHSISVAGVTDPAQPYLGQWINMEVTGVALH